MSDRPLIGVPTQTLHAIDGIPEGLPHSWVMNRRYYDALAYVGAVPVMVPLFDDDEDTLRALFDRLDGVFLAGGVDLDPESYGAARHERCGRTDLARDRVEIQLVRWAVARAMPVLGVCRGMQVLNVAAGGTLHQDFDACVPGSIKHDYYPTAGYARDHLAHDVRLVAGSRLSRAFGAADAPVNSMHHQGIARLGDGLAPTAYAADGLIEALEGTGDAFVVGVQWHPEMLVETDAGTRRLFEEFVEAARDWKRVRTTQLLLR
ncbi:MAG: gamma-glutamyl-gamma-aminobutyrate hydrolase family protein [Longimicrobiales bacterium]